MTNRLLSPLPRCLNQDIEQERKAPWLNWIEQPPPKGQVAGSNPAGVASHTVIIEEIGYTPKVCEKLCKPTSLCWAWLVKSPDDHCCGTYGSAVFDALQPSQRDCR